MYDDEEFTETLHTCSYQCQRVECMKAQRLELLAENERLRGIITEAEHLAQVEPGRLLWRIINMKDALKLSHRELQRAQAELAECKGWLKHYERPYKSLKEAITKAQDEAYERAAQECDGFASCEGIAQQCATAIRALKSNPPQLADSNTVDNSRSSDDG